MCIIVLKNVLKRIVRLSYKIKWSNAVHVKACYSNDYHNGVLIFKTPNCILDELSFNIKI